MARSGFPRVITIISCLAAQKNAAPGRDEVTVLKNIIKQTSYVKRFSWYVKCSFGLGEKKLKSFLKGLFYWKGLHNKHFILPLNTSMYILNRAVL